MKEYIPYTYLIGWSKQDKWYYGCQYGKSSHIANPNNLWKTYFTSSKYVNKCRNLYGEPDVIEIRKIFTDGERCRLWEQTVLEKLKAVKSDKWLNKQSHSKFFCSSDETSKKISEALMGNIPWNKGIKLGPQSKEFVERRTKQSGIARRGKTLSEDHKKSLSVAHLGQIPWNKGKKNSQVPWNKGKTEIYSEEVKKSMGIKNIGKSPWNKKESLHEVN